MFNQFIIMYNLISPTIYNAVILITESITKLDIKIS